MWNAAGTNDLTKDIYDGRDSWDVWTEQVLPKKAKAVEEGPEVLQGQPDGPLLKLKGA